MLNKYGYKAFHRSERCAVNHYRTMLLVIGSHILKIESFRQVIIYLNSSQLPTTTDSVFHHEVQFRTIKSSFTIFNFCFQPLFLTRFDDCLLCLFPIFVTSDIFLTVHFITKRNLSFKIREVHWTEYNWNNIHYTKKFSFHLIGTAKNMCIILRKATNTGQPVKFTALLITTYCSELSNTQRQIFIRTGKVFINLTMMRAVHRL